MRKTATDRIFDVINISFMIFVMLIILYPLYFTIIASFSEPYAVAKGQVSFWPKGFTLEAYRNVFLNQQIWIGYRNSMIYTLLGTLLNLFLTIPTAYVLSKKKLPGRLMISWFFLLTMFFGGGLIPSYILIRSIGLLDKAYTLIVLGGISIFNIVVSRVYFETTIPESLYEAAYIDGSSELRTFLTIALPLSAPIIAVIALYYGVSRWNDYFTGLIFISSREYQPLQLVLRAILILNQSMLKTLDFSSPGDADARVIAMRLAYMAQAMKYSIIIISSLPMLIAYPFVQKYFVKGVMIGSLKG